jgi:hypothetical protein
MTIAEDPCSLALCTFNEWQHYTYKVKVFDQTEIKPRPGEPSRK